VVTRNKVVILTPVSLSGGEQMLDDPLWKCPVCRGQLGDRRTALECPACQRAFDVVDGIPDFRLAMPSWIDVADDTRTARELSEARLPLSELVRTVYSRRIDDAAWVDRRTREVLEGPERLREDIRGWLAPVIAGGPFLDLGCGGGMLMAAAADVHPGLQTVGIDVSMVWLVVAKKMVTEHGGRPMLAAAMAEALPFADETIPAVVSLDVIEHVAKAETYLGEINRVLKVGGRTALSTPNRFSLTAEPHVFVWGVGWLPRRLQRAYVRWRSGMPYESTVLMSSVGLARKLRRSTQLQFRILIPMVADGDIVHFPPAKRKVARLFNRISQTALFRPMFLWIGPFFRVTGTKIAAGLMWLGVSLAAALGHGLACIPTRVFDAAT
jgi:2-polyprenyl-3-methyl-5-hydroxy-6-metoxy-1,4-benzoquinol methylase